MRALKLFLLGNPELRRDDEVLPKPPTQKSQSLLAYLATHRDAPHPRHKLIGLFWGESGERRARRSLSTALWQVRRALAAGEPDSSEYILAERDTVQFDPQSDYWLDVAFFEAQVRRQIGAGMDGVPSADIRELQQALDLYRGEFLAGFYDDWVISERYRLEALFLEGLAWLLEAHQARGEHEEALACARRLLRQDPLREDVHRQAMRLYVQLGHPVAALQQYYRCREVLREEIGIEPAPETTALAQELLGVELRAEEPLVAPHQGRTPFDVGRAVLAGRDQELSDLLRQWEQCLEGEGRLILISGEAGVGKTRLAEALAENVRWQGAKVMWGRCYEHERSLPYQPMIEAVRSALPTLTPADFEAIPGEWLAEVARLAPELRERWPQIPAPVPLTPAQERSRLFDAVARSVLILSRRAPIFLVLEDLQWAGESTLQFLHFLTRHLPGTQVLVLGTFRREEVGRRHPLRDLTRRLGQEELATRMELGRLAPEAVQELLGEMSGLGEGIAPVAQRLYRETEGNPFFLTETVKALFEAGLLRLEGGVWQYDQQSLAEGKTLPLPRSVGELIEARLARLSDAAGQALNVAAVAGQGFDFEALRLAWGKDEERTLEAIEELLRRQLIGEGTGAIGREYEFTHHLVREVVYRGLHHRRRHRLHRLVGEAMETVYRPHLDEHVAELAHHFYHGLGRDPTKAVTYGLQAGDRARNLYANREALQWYQQTEQALRKFGLFPLEALCKTGDRSLADAGMGMLFGRGMVQMVIGQCDDAQESLQEALAWARTIGDEASEAHILHALGRVHHERANFPLAKQTFQKAVALFEALGDKAGLAATLDRLGRTCYDQGVDPDETERLVREALRLSQEVGDRNQEALALWSLARTLYRRAEFRQSEERYQAALSALREVGNREDEGWTLLLLGLNYGFRYELDRAQALFLKALALFRKLDLRWGEGAALTQLGMTHFRRGDVVEAERLWRSALQTVEELDSRWEQAAVLWRLGLGAHRRGEVAEARALLGRGEAMANEIGHRELQMLILLSVGDLEANLGHWTEADTAYQQALELCQATEDRRFMPRAYHGLGLVALAHSSHDQALGYARLGREAASDLDVEVQGMLWRLTGRARMALGDQAAAEEAFQRSIAVLERGVPMGSTFARMTALGREKQP